MAILAVKTRRADSTFLLAPPGGQAPLHGQAVRPEGGQRQYVSQYEVTYILRPSLEDPQVDEHVNHFSAVVTNNGGELKSAERLGKRRLAYEVQKLREGHYVSVQFSSSPEVAKEVIRQMRLHENVLRTLLVKM